MVASRNAFSPRSGSKPCLPDAVLPDVTRHGNFISAPLDRCHPPSLLPEEKMPNFVRRMPCCLTSRAMAISFLHRSTGAAPKPSPRGEGAELCSPDAVEASSAFRRLPHFQSSMLLHNLSSVFSLGRKASQRARRGSRVPHQRPPRRARPQAHTKPHPAAAPHRPHSPQRQVFHRVFHIFAGFPQRLSFPLAFLERDSVRSSEPWVLPAA